MLKDFLRFVLSIFLLTMGLHASYASAQSYELYNGDTINRVDVNNRKQGYWIIFGKMKQTEGYADSQIIEEGEYINSRKNGHWKAYFSDGKLKSEINYVNNRPNGEYKIYYNNGIVEEQGSWVNNRNTGNFERKYENGQPQQKFSFNEGGKREGKQVYYYNNGQVMIEGDWNGGQESGPITQYYANGDVKAKQYFNNGEIDKEKTVYLEPKKPEELKKEEKNIEEQNSKNEPIKIAPKLQEGEKINNPLERFDGNGKHTFYNKNRQVTQTGEFKNGRILNGEIRKYDENGLIMSVEIYENGRYVGEGPLPKE